MEYSAGEILLYDQETIQYYNPQVTLITIPSSVSLNNLGSGEMFITTQRVHWKNSDLEISKPYQQFGLHAISRDMNNLPAPCLYCQLFCEELEEGQEPTQWLFIPSQSDQLQSMFDAFTECSAMNPSPESDELQAGNMLGLNLEDFEDLEDLEDMEMEQANEPMDTDQY